jgi:phasin family protein
MVDEVKTPTEAATETKARPVAAPADTATTAAVAEKPEPKMKKVARKAAPKAATRAARKTKKIQRAKPQKKAASTGANERNDQMTFEPTNLFAGIGAFPGGSAFEKLFADATGRGEEAAKRSRKVAEEFADLYRGNIDAFVEASKIAATGAQSIGQEIVAKGRDSVEQTANTVRSFAEAKSPTELMQLQSEYARSAFDRMIEDSSNLTESLVKLAGEAFQPLSNRASATVERFNDVAA